MNKTILRKSDSEYYDYIIETTAEIDASLFLSTYKNCTVLEEKYIDDVLIETITHEL